MSLVSVSVIIPVFNVENYVGKTLDSLQRQTNKDFEIIVVNDGSTDGTESVITKFAALSDMTIKVINKSNSGVSVSRNIGLSEAIGEFVVFLDGDDFVECNFIRLLSERIRHSSCEIAVCLCQKIDALGVVLDPPSSKYFHTPPVLSSPKALSLYLHDNNRMLTGAVVYKREILQRYNIRFNQKLKYAEDQEFNVKAIYHSKNVAFENTILLNYVQRDSSAAHCPDFEKLYDNVKAYDNLRKYFEGLHDLRLTVFIKSYKIPQNIGAVLTKCAIINDIRNYKRLLRKRAIRAHLLGGLFYISTTLILRTKYFFVLFLPELTRMLYKKAIIK